MTGMNARATHLDFYLARAEQARVEAKAATLDHVRERCRRSEEAWMAFADRARQLRQLQISEDERKAAKTLAKIDDATTQAQ